MTDRDRLLDFLTAQSLISQITLELLIENDVLSGHDVYKRVAQRVAEIRSNGTESDLRVAEAMTPILRMLEKKGYGPEGY